MELMPLVLEWHNVALRLSLAFVAGALIGLNRGGSGQSAGLRTTLLVCLAACLAMLQVNALLAQSGKTPDTFAELDLMRLPLGILSGVGFISAGAILRKDGLVKGITTAATMWFVTVIGLLIGGGQLVLGTVGLALGITVLWLVKMVEQQLRLENHATVTLHYSSDEFDRERFVESLRQRQCEAYSSSGGSDRAQQLVRECFDVRWVGRLRDSPPGFTEMATAAGARRVRWTVRR